MTKDETIRLQAEEIERLREQVAKYKARLQIVRDALPKELAEWYDFDGVPT